MNVLRCGQWISSLTYPHVVDWVGFILVLISWQSFSSLSLFQSRREPYQPLRQLAFSLSMLCNCLASLMWFYTIVMLVLQPIFGAVCGNCWVLGCIIFHLPSTVGWADRIYLLYSGIGNLLCYGLVWVPWGLLAQTPWHSWIGYQFSCLGFYRYFTL